MHMMLLVESLRKSILKKHIPTITLFYFKEAFSFEVVLSTVMNGFGDED